ACTSSAVALLGPCSTSRPSSSAISAESPNAKAITSGPSWPLSAAYDAHIASTAAWSAGAMSTNAILGSAAEANPAQGPQKHPHMPHIAGWDGSWSGWSAGVLALGIKAPEVQVRAFCTLPGDLRMLIAGPHPVVSP